MKWQGKSVRKFTGGRLIRSRGKRKHEIGREPAETHVGETKKKIIKVRGGGRKIRLLKADTVNVTIPGENIVKKASIETVIGNPANIHYVRRNIITRGALLKTDIGTVRVTNRPGQEGTVNAVLVEE